MFSRIESALNGLGSPRLLDADAFRTVFDDEPPADPPVDGDPPADPPAGDGNGDKKKTKLKVVLSTEQQEFVNSLLAEERRKSKATTDRVITQLETLKNQVGTTTAEKEALEARIEDLKNSQLTAEELRKKDERKKEEKWQKDLADAKTDADKWKKMFTDSTIHRAIVDAATKSEHRAYNPRHIVNELTPYTKLVDEVDEEGKATGQLVPRVRMTTVKDGKQVTLAMTATEAVKFLSEQEEHAPLFNSGATGGLGGNPNNPSRRGSNPDEPPTDPAQYQEWRKKHRGFSGAPRR